MMKYMTMNWGYFHPYKKPFDIDEKAPQHCKQDFKDLFDAKSYIEELHKKIEVLEERLSNKRPSTAMTEDLESPMKR